MKTLDLLSDKELPEGFTDPSQFKHIVELGLVELHLESAPLREPMAGLAERYPSRKLIPFARRQDNDDIARWQAESTHEIIVIHDFASAGWEESGRFATFYVWFRSAIEDLIAFDS